MRTTEQPFTMTVAELQKRHDADPSVRVSLWCPQVGEDGDYLRVDVRGFLEAFRFTGTVPKGVERGGACWVDEIVRKEVACV